MKLRFHQFAAALAYAHDIGPLDRPAFLARLRGLQRQGLDLPARGKGNTANFSPADLFKFAFALEFAQLGVPPSSACFWVNHFWDQLIGTVHAVLEDVETGSSNIRFLLIEPTLITDDIVDFIEWSGGDATALAAVGNRCFPALRQAVFNVSALVNLLEIALAATGTDILKFNAALRRDRNAKLAAKSEARVDA